MQCFIFRKKKKVNIWMVNYVLTTIQEPQQMFTISSMQEFTSKLLVIKHQNIFIWSFPAILK